MYTKKMQQGRVRIELQAIIVVGGAQRHVPSIELKPGA